MNQKEIRWKQRFQNFEKAYKLLEKYAAIKEPNELERAGIIQFFETSFELAWKLMKDYLEAEGFILQSPRATIKQALQSNIIEDGHIWLDALTDRNLTVHTYDEKTAIEVTKMISNSYFPNMRKLFLFMSSESKK